MHRILMVGSVPLAAPWNGADKNLARMLVEYDPTNQFILRTSQHDVWPNHVRALRTSRVETMPTASARLRAFGDILCYAHQADILHIVASLRAPSPLALALVHVWPRMRGLPVVHTVPSIGDRPVDLRHFYGDVTVVVSEQTRRRLTEHGVRNVVRVFPPLDAKSIAPRSDPNLLVESLQLGRHAILYPTHYGAHSGISEAIQALALLPPALSDAVLVVAGRTRRGQNATEEAARVHAQAVAAGVGERVRVIGQVTDIHALISACTITALLPARLESKMDLPLVILESLALGRPVILGNQPPLNEALLGGGLSVPHGDIAALSQAFATLLANGWQRQAFAEAGRRAVLERCDPTRIVRQYREIYNWATELTLDRTAMLAEEGNLRSPHE